MKNYGSIHYSSKDNDWIIDQLDLHVRIKIKSIFTKIGKTNSPPYYFKNNPENCKDLHWFTDRYPLKISNSDKSKLENGSKEYERLIEQKEVIFYQKSHTSDITLKSGYSFRDYQNQFLNLFKIQKRMILGDDVGLGKTLQGIGACLFGNTLPAIVVVQTHLVEQWVEDEFPKYTNLKIQVLEGRTPKPLQSADVYVIRYSVVAYWKDVLISINPKLFIMDECQEVRVYGSEKYKGCSDVADACEYVLGLSATPIYNYGDEIWAIMNVIAKDSLGSSIDFSREWCGFTKEVRDPSALGQYLRSNHLMLRRTREDVKRELPVINTIIHHVEADKKAIDSIEDEARVLARTIFTGSFIERGAAARDLDIKLRLATGVAKAKSVAALAKLFLDNKEPVMIAGWHRDVYEIWNKELEKYKPVMYTGSENKTQKRISKTKFVNGETDLMFISLRSGSGINGLQNRCKYLIIGEFDWSPEVHKQLIGRLQRERSDNGEQNQVTVIYCKCNYGSDPTMISILGVKSSQAHGINNPNKNMEVKHTDTSRIKKLAAEYLAANGDNYGMTKLKGETTSDEEIITFDTKIDEDEDQNLSDIETTMLLKSS